MAYDARFLGTELALPAVDGDVDVPILDYMHFTVAMNRQRRLAWWAAWNIDGLRLFPGEDIDRGGQQFRLDERLPAAEQTTNEVYDVNRLDRGHIARRADLLWGTRAEAERANADSFHFTNITPQMDNFNQAGRGGVWGQLENGVLDLTDLTDRRLTVFGGPVLADTDPPYRNLVQVPRQHWKVVAYRLDEHLRCKTFLLSQDLDPDRIEPSYLEEFRTYEITIPDLQARTGIALPDLADLRAQSAPPDPIQIDDIATITW